MHMDKFQKQPSRVVLRKRCSQNMQQIYGGTPMWKCDFNKVATFYRAFIVRSIMSFCVISCTYIVTYSHYTGSIQTFGNDKTPSIWLTTRTITIMIISRRRSFNAFRSWYSIRCNSFSPWSYFFPEIMSDLNTAEKQKIIIKKISPCFHGILIFSCQKGEISW